MRDPARIYRMLAQLAQIWASNPDMRFGQMVEVIHDKVPTKDTIDIFVTEDDAWEKAMKIRMDEINGLKELQRQGQEFDKEDDVP